MVVIKIIHGLAALIFLYDVSFRGSTSGNRLQSNDCFRSNNRFQVNELSGRRRPSVFAENDVSMTIFIVAVLLRALFSPFVVIVAIIHENIAQ